MTAKRILLALTLAVVAAFSTTGLHAQSNEKSAFERGFQSSANKARRLEGSWIITVTPTVPAARPVRTNYTSFARAGRIHRLRPTGASRQSAARRWETSAAMLLWNLFEKFRPTGNFRHAQVRKKTP